MTTAVFHPIDLADQKKTAKARSVVTRLSDLLRRHDERLLRDIGLTRRDVLGVEGLIQADWRRNRDIWSL